ncbi:type III secretion system cytoplasmic ring protein SctQ [Burkholderia sp. NLJ2]|uniref:type III secretion system cytoplasmic ring protein SctQ n=1 Tax=Burkholderia sp. NLJ2 TaxID=3090699 RepID=UPI003C6CB421
MFDTRIGALAASVPGLASCNVTVVDNLLVFINRLVDAAVIELSIGAPGGAIAFSVFVAIDLDAHPDLDIAAYPERDNACTRTATSEEMAMRRTIAGILLEPLVKCLDHFGLPSPCVVSVTRRCAAERADDWAGQPAVGLSLAFDERRIDCAISLPMRGYDIVDTLLRTLPAARRPALVIPGALIIGVRTLSVDTLNALEAGDVLLRSLFPHFDATLFSTDMPVTESRCAVAAWGARGHIRIQVAVRIHDESFVIEKEFSMSEEVSQASAGIDVASHEEPTRIGELELPVQFEIDTVSLPIEQLSVLEPGYVIELPTAVRDAQLKLVVHGQTVGYGELVAVGEHLGVRIIRMAHRHGTVQ